MDSVFRLFGSLTKLSSDLYMSAVAPICVHTSTDTLTHTHVYKHTHAHTVYRHNNNK